MLHIETILGKRILIIGDVNTGKTLLTSRILKELINLGYEKEITIIDMAPEKRGVIGGTLTDYIDIPKGMKYLRPLKVYAPRTTAKNREELILMAEENARNIEKLIDSYLRNPTSILIINDLTLYLHAGNLDRIIKCIRKSKTFIGNAYYGEKIKDQFKTNISLREKILVEKLLKLMDIVINLNKVSRKKEGKRR